MSFRKSPCTWLWIAVVFLLSVAHISFLVTYTRNNWNNFDTKCSLRNSVRDETGSAPRKVRKDALDLTPFEGKKSDIEEKPKINGYPESLFPRSAVFEIDDAISTCSVQSKARNLGEVGDEFERTAIKSMVENKCEQPLPWKDFVCLAQCPSIEPELEESMPAQRIARYPLWLMKDLCDRQIFPALIYIQNGRILVQKCTRDRIRGTQVWRDMTRLLFMLNCVVQLPDMVFGLDNADWATPQASDPFESVHWNTVIPAVIRLVGTASHPSLLWPTGPFAYHSAYCHVRSNNPKKWFLRCPHGTFSSIDRWKSKKKGICWRGSMTGVPMYQGLARYLPRSAIAKVAKSAENEGLLGYDIGIIGDGYGVNSALKKTGYMEKRSFKKSMYKDHMYEYQYVMHVDGHTASWGLTDKLTSGTVTVWQESPLGYREHFYTHLEPWKHYIPMDAGLSNMESIREWATDDSTLEDRHKLAKQMTRNNMVLFQTELRGEAMWCYMMRLLYSLAEQQETLPTEEAMKAVGFDLTRFRPLKEEKQYRDELGIPINESEFW